ncbi:hypothetical protein A3J13_01495 [Candidatus Daviesbacteria bacterium RIFCSPLOWO2_02_FULL_36_8]|uniref:Type II secretion system protein GspG C-terminal domain-containing protein n=1 Tax=Candidatus Daviesbacteria bacterium RIFCSPLOWO2_02_FULL_36_8 TaxID=1797793 RepID=A0A1F5MGU2_9BACT|nr:MAG: hypothetical protein A3J13_01495 [Candidatus Daviesbacteria bacterium RIFCSPLOWO2_02_FULL_36_8]
MKKLPSFKSSGFTLIELMVVISIIAILSVIGVSVYGNVQKTARDGIRRAEIAILRNSIEGGRDITAGTYSYDSTKYAADFPQNKPKDPLKSTTAPYYCFATSSGATPAMPPVPTAWAATDNCPTDAASTDYSAWSTLVNSTSVYGTAITAVKYWRICTRLEGPTTMTPVCGVSSY